MKNNLLLYSLILISGICLKGQEINVIDTDFSKGRLTHIQTITLDDIVKFHGHQCNGLVEGYKALSEAFVYLYPDGVVDRTNTRIISKSSPCLTDVAIYLTGGRYQFNRFYIDDRMDGMFYVQRIDNGNAVYVKRKDGIKPKVIDSLTTLALSGKLTPCDLKSLELYEEKYAEKLISSHSMDLFDLYLPTKKTKRNWKPNTKYDYVKTDILYKNAEECDINKGVHSSLFLSLPPLSFMKNIENNDVVVLDVRTPEELLQTGILKNAINIDFLNKDFERSIDILEKDKTYYVYCRSGRRSFSAMEMMKEKGFKKLVMLDGGILEYISQKLPLYKR